ncbi:MAG: GGDEF domain-containing protein [Campylobacter sp.]
MAAITVSQIIKEALGEIKERHLMLTPENYTEAFNQISKKYGFSTEESRKIEKYISRLGGEYKSQALGLNIKTIDEFVAFVTARLLSGSAQGIKLASEQSEEERALNAFARRILQATAMLHNKEVKSLAEDSMRLLVRKFDATAIDEMKQRWLNFINGYNDDFLEFLKCYGVRNFDDLKVMCAELEAYLSKNDDSGAHAIIELICMGLEPSLSAELYDELIELKSEIKKTPAYLKREDMQNKIKYFVYKRIEADRAEVKAKFSSLNGILGSISQKIAKIAENSKSSSDRFESIKNDLSSVNFGVNSIEQVRNTLFDIAGALEIESRGLAIEMSIKQATILKLQERVNILEKELEAARLESKEDFLTKLGTKRALMHEIEQIEIAYRRYGTDFSICFIDIDFFKNINDNYGHDAGDAVLSAVAKILKSQSRKIDFIGRYGGEEFVILLPNTGLNDAVKFADKLRAMIENFKFIYKDERIAVSISSGIATRSANISETLTLESADKMLYAAKEAGRNRVMPKIIE